MFRGLLFLALTIESALALCELNANKTACEASVFDCVHVCELYNSQNACNAIHGCSWLVTKDSYGAPTGYCRNNTIFPNCYNFTTTECDANPMCGVRETPCNMGMYCLLNNTASCPIYETVNCTSYGPGCALAPLCSHNHPCVLLFDQSSCIAREGCYWSDDTFNNRSYKSCNPCFTDFTKTENAFLSMQARVGRTCSLPDNASLTITVRAAISSATGCSGGGPAFELVAFSVCDPPLAESAAATTFNEKLSSANYLVMMSSIAMFIFFAR